MSDQECLTSQWKLKVLELLQITSDPLLSDLDTVETGFSEFILSLSIDKGLDLHKLPTLTDYDGDLDRVIRDRIAQILKEHRNQAVEVTEAKKEDEVVAHSSDEITEEVNNATKIEEDVIPSAQEHNEPRDTTQEVTTEPLEGLKRKSSDLQVESRKLQKIASPEEALVMKEPEMEIKIHAPPPDESLADLDIIIAPEHYPTHPHAVSSLSELYYLTQTLPLIKLLPGSHKVLLSENFELALLEGKIAVLYSRIEELKRQGKWSLRQPRKFNDPFKKGKTPHWDTVVMEGKWMATDFREASKFKKATCVMIAQAIHDYWTYGKEVCIKPRPIQYLSDDVEMTETGEEKDEADAKTDETTEDKPEKNTEEMTDEPAKVATEAITKESTKESNKETEEQSSDPAVQGKEDTLPSSVIDEAQDTSVKEEASEVVKLPGHESEGSSLNTGILVDNAPAGQQGEEDTTSTTIDPQGLTEAAPEVPIVEEPQGPMFIPQKYGDAISSGYPFRLNMDYSEVPRLEQSIFTHLPKFTGFDSDEVHHPKPPLTTRDSPMVPVSRLIHPFEEDNMWYKLVVKESARNEKPTGPPEYQKGLFNSNAHRRFNFLKPPKPPLIKNIEYRLPTIWLPEDDKHLIHYVAEFCFNWELISNHLLSPSSTLKRYESNIERRTPWQCFERYIQLNEKFQFSDMKGMYAHHAQKWLEHAHGAQLTTKRRISPLGVGNESIQRGHRRLRWASMFDAMRKSMRKREIALAKMNKKRNEANSVSTPSATPVGTPPQKRPTDRIPTPLELSKLKFERDKSIHEAYVNQQATRSRMMAAVAQQKKAGASPPSGETDPQTQALLQGAAAGAAGPRLAQVGPGAPPTAGQLRQVPPGGNSLQQQMPNLAPGQAQMQGQRAQVSNQQRGMPVKRPTSPNGTPYTTEQIQQILMKRRQGQAAQMNPASPAVTQLNQMSQQLNNGAKPQVSRGVNLAATSSAQAQQMSQGQKPQAGQVPSPNLRYNQVQPSNNNAKSRIHFAPAQVSAIINSIQNKNPNLTKEQVTKLAATYLANIQQQQQSRINQQQPQQPSQLPAQSRKQPQIANLTPQERSQLQMLKNRKSNSPENTEQKPGDDE